MSSGLDSNMQKAQVNGWVYAGAYYYSLAGTSNAVQDSYSDFINASKIALFNNQDPNAPDFKDLSPTDPQIQITNNAKYLTTQAAAALNTTMAAGGGMLASSGGTSGKLASASKGVMRMWMNAIAPGTGNPVASIQSFGHNVLLAADILCVTYFVASIGAAFFGTHIVELGFTVSPWYQTILQGLSLLTTALFFLVAYMVTVGGLMGVYVPLIPFVLFSLGVIGWMIVVIEAMVAGPVIALGLLMPGGQHEIFSHAAASLMLTLNLMLRPTFMIFGMFAAMLLSGIAVIFINSAFYSVVGSFTSHPGMFDTFLFIFAYAGLVIIALNKCFELIHIIPDRTLHWIGHQGAGSGDMQAAAELKGKVGAGAEAGAGAAKGVGGTAAGQAQDYGKQAGEGAMSSADKQKALDKKHEELKDGGPNL
jgi:conjugal transfer/type IV secretion protein DotA/TraY